MLDDCVLDGFSYQRPLPISINWKQFEIENWCFEMLLSSSVGFLAKRQAFSNQFK